MQPQPSAPSPKIIQRRGDPCEDGSLRTMQGGSLQACSAYQLDLLRKANALARFCFLAPMVTAKEPASRKTGGKETPATKPTSSKKAPAKGATRSSTSKTAAKRSPIKGADTKKTPAKKSPAKKGAKKDSSANACWPGFEPTPGKMQGEKGSCKPKKTKSAGEKKGAQKAAGAAKLSGQRK